MGVSKVPGVRVLREGSKPEGTGSIPGTNKHQGVEAPETPKNHRGWRGQSQGSKVPDADLNLNLPAPECASGLQGTRSGSGPPTHLPSRVRRTVSQVRGHVEVHGPLQRLALLRERRLHRSLPGEPRHVVGHRELHREHRLLERREVRALAEERSHVVVHGEVQSATRLVEEREPRRLLEERRRPRSAPKGPAAKGKGPPPAAEEGRREWHRLGGHEEVPPVAAHVSGRHRRRHPPARAHPEVH